MPSPARVVEHSAREGDQVCLAAGDDFLSLLRPCNKADGDGSDIRAVLDAFGERKLVAGPGSRKGIPAKSRRCVAPPPALIVTSEGASSLRVSQANSPEAPGRSCLPTIAEPSRTRRKAFAPASSSCSNVAPSSMRASIAEGID
jgi:hypothetical protein